MADTKQQWYKDAKYGLFIHWGLYSILAGEWKDPKTGEVTKTDRIAEWMTDMRCRSPTHGCTAITRISHSLIWDLTRYFLTR